MAFAFKSLGSNQYVIRKEDIDASKTIIQKCIKSKLVHTYLQICAGYGPLHFGDKTKILK